MAAGGILIGPMLFGHPHLLGSSIFVLQDHNHLATLAAEFHGARMMALQAGQTLPFWLALAGIVTAWFFNLRCTHLAEKLKNRFSWLYAIFVAKYGFDDFNQIVFVRGTRKLGYVFV